MPRRLTPSDLARFLHHLADTGNIALAAERSGRAKSGLYKLRARDPGFAARCTAALTLFRTRQSPSLLAGEGESRVERDRGEGTAQPTARTSPHNPHKTKGGELRLYTSRKHPPQLRRAQPGRLTPAGEAAFLAALGATANVRLSAESVGVKPSSVHARRRRGGAFATAWDEALKLACDRLTLAMIEQSTAFLEGRPSAAPEWEATGPTLPAPAWPEPRIAPISMTDALALLAHHKKQTRRKQEAHRRPRLTMDDVRASISRKVEAIRRKHADNGEGS